MPKFFEVVAFFCDEASKLAGVPLNVCNKRSVFFLNIMIYDSMKNLVREKSQFPKINEAIETVFVSRLICKLNHPYFLKISAQYLQLYK